MTMSMSEAHAGHGTVGRWFVVANGSHGKVLVKRDGESGYDQLHDWDEPDARRRDADLGEDKPGRTFRAAGVSQRSAMERDGTDDAPKEHAKRDFARRMAEELAEAVRSGRARSFVLVAPAQVAEAVLGHIPADARRALVGEDHHDLTGLPIADLYTRLDALHHGV